MDFSYNLLDEPWINTLDLTGEPRTMGINSLMEEAHLLKKITDPSPMIEYGIYRFLIALVMDIFEIQAIEDIEEMLDTKHFNKSIMEGYFKNWYTRFDLFDVEHPFYQSPSGKNDPKKTKNISELFFQFPTGVSPIHFYHKRSDDHAVSPEICARGICTIPAFALQGGSGYSPGINGTPPWYILISGDNLFETLLYNSCGMAISEASGTGNVAWKNDIAIVPKMQVTEVSLVEGLTLQPRYIRFIPTEGGICTYTGKRSNLLVSEIYYQPGLTWRGDWRDPHVAYFFKDNSPRGIRPQKGREIWRDTGPIALLKRRESNNIKYDRPVIITQFEKLQEELTMEEEKQLVLQIYGARAKQKKVYEWFYTRLKLPFKLILNEESGIVLQNALEKADEVNSALRTAIKVMHPREAKQSSEEKKGKKKKKTNAKIFERIQERATRRFWKTLEPEFKGKFLTKLAQAVNTSNWTPVNTIWLKTLRKVGKQILNETIGPLDTDADFIKRQVQAEQVYSNFTFKIFKDLIEQKKIKKEEN